MFAGATKGLDSRTLLPSVTATAAVICGTEAMVVVVRPSPMFALATVAVTFLPLYFGISLNAALLVLAGRCIPLKRIAAPESAAHSLGLTGN